MGALIIIVIVAVCVYFKVIRPQKEKREEEERQRIERQRNQEKCHREREQIAKELKTGYAVQSCSELIDAYWRLLDEHIFDIHAGSIYIIAPEPKNKYGKETVTVVFRAYFDDYRLRDLLQGNLKMLYIKGNDVSRFDEHIVPGSAEMESFLISNGVPDILFEKYSTEVGQFDTDEVQWVTKLHAFKYDFKGLYGQYEQIGYNDRMEILAGILKQKHPYIENLLVLPKLYT